MNKKILFIAPQFFGYENDIKEELSIQGAEVDFIPDRPFSSPILKAITRHCRSLILPFAKQYFIDSVKAFGRIHYDVIFVVQGEALSHGSLSFLRAKFPRARLILYLWDSLKNKKSLIKNLPKFDICFTFDQADSFLYGLNFRPLFFAPRFMVERNLDPIYKVSFIGTAHSDRLKIISNVFSALPKGVSVFKWLYLQAPWVFWLQKLTNSAFKNSSYSDFHYAPMAKEQVQNIFFNSMAILDIEHPGQAGLTMRTLEAIGARKKLITTNQSALNADFYEPQNVLVIDRDNIPNIPASFLTMPYKPISTDIYERYTLKCWLSEILVIHPPHF
jgi:hypothetical protein